MLLIQPPCHITRSEAGNKVVFVIADAAHQDIVITPVEMTWNPQAIEDAHQRADLVCTALNAYLAPK